MENLPTKEILLKHTANYHKKTWVQYKIDSSIVKTLFVDHTKQTHLKAFPTI
jgi:hypothetical protein